MKTKIYKKHKLKSSSAPGESFLQMLKYNHKSIKKTKGELTFQSNIQETSSIYIKLQIKLAYQKPSILSTIYIMVNYLLLNECEYPLVTEILH